MHVQLRRELPLIPLFAFLVTCPAEAVDRLLPLLDVAQIDNVGVDVIASGRVSERLYVLALGSVDILLPNGLCVAQLHARAPEAHNSYPFFGERGMLWHAAAAASVRTASACKFLYVSRKNFGKFLEIVRSYTRARVGEGETPPNHHDHRHHHRLHHPSPPL